MAMDNFKLLWQGKVLKLKINANQYLLEVSDIYPKTHRNSQIYFNETEKVTIEKYDHSIYTHIRYNCPDFFALYDF